MRSDKQFAIVLAIALGVVPVFAGQHSSAPQHSDAPHQSASRQSATHPSPASPSTSSRAYPSQHQVPRPPAGQYDRQVSNRSTHSPDAQRQYSRSPQRHSVPRPPMRTDRFSAQAGSEPSPQHEVPRPPQARGSSAAAPPVGNAQAPVPRPPIIGTPRDVHRGGPHAGDWLRRYDNLPPQQRQHALEADPNFKRLPTSAQQRYKNQLDQFNSKPPQEQQRLINRMDAWGHLSQAQRDEARQTYGQLKSMPTDRQQQVNQAYRRLRAMPPSAREQVLNSPDFQSRFSEQERNVIKNMTDINNSLPH